jgi:hypothetical protein
MNACADAFGLAPTRFRRVPDASGLHVSLCLIGTYVAGLRIRHVLGTSRAWKTSLLYTRVAQCRQNASNASAGAGTLLSASRARGYEGAWSTHSSLNASKRVGTRLPAAQRPENRWATPRARELASDLAAGHATAVITPEPGRWAGGVCAVPRLGNGETDDDLLWDVVLDEAARGRLRGDGGAA